jgi:tetraacyldisaccharide 4'-kinase
MKPSVSFEVPTLVLGNLIAGGSGKTPHVQYVVEKLLGKGRFGILSRGYGRKTKGFLAVKKENTSEEVGDEPLQYKNRFGDAVDVAVGEQRILAIPEMIVNGVEGIVLDDAFQHRKLRAKAYVLLTEYKRPFYADYVLPSGLLRESRKGAERADFIVVTKCPSDKIEFNDVKLRIRKYNQNAPIAFSTYDYSDLKLVVGQEKKEVIVFSGIANSNLFEDYVSSKYKVKFAKKFGDHHSYSAVELKKLVALAKEKKAMLVTTEKDYMRIYNNEVLEKIMKEVSFGYIPIQVRFVEGGNQFDDFVKKIFNVE